MFIKVDGNGQVVESSSEREEGFLKKDFDIDSEKFLFAKCVDGKIVYDEENYKKHIENRTIRYELLNEINEIENWLNDYDRICNEKMRCDRLGIECHHNMEELDSLALIKIARLNEIRQM